MPADRLEKAVAEAIAQQLEDTGFAIHILDVPIAAEIERVRQTASDVCGILRGEDRNALLAEIMAGGSISPDALAIELNSQTIAHLLQAPSDRINVSNLSIVALAHPSPRGRGAVRHRRWRLRGGSEPGLEDRNSNALV